jgi:hypothetical protein
VKLARPRNAAARRRLGSILALLLTLPLAGVAAEPAWWSQMKSACIASGGRPSSTSYDSWVAGGGCVCPGSSGGSGKATCPGGSGSASASAGSPVADVVTGVMTSNPGQLGAGLGGLLGAAIADSLTSSASVAPPDPEAVQRRLDAENAARARQQARTDRLDREAFLRMSLLDAPFNPEKRLAADARPSVACRQAAEGQLACHVPVCGGALNGPSVCCPAGFPKLNECDCKCYAADASFECMRFAACNQSTGTKLTDDEPPAPGPEARK